MGLVDFLSAFKVQGWAFDRHRPGLAVELVIRVDGMAVKRFRPQLFWPVLAARLGLAADGLGPVRFSVNLPSCVADGQNHTVEVACARSGKLLPSEQSTEVQFINPHLPISELPLQWLRLSAQSQRRRVAPPSVTVIVLNRNGADVLSALFISWMTHNRSVVAEWIVIDHASTDQSLEILDHWSSQLPLRVEALSQNQSFSASCNLGARLARTPHLLFLNNDIVWQQDALPEMLDTLNRTDVCAVGLKLLKTVASTGSQEFTEVQHLGVRFCLAGSGYAPFELIPDGREREYAPQNVPAVTAAAMLCRASDFWAAGGFDEDYFYGYEDVEFCIRLRAKTRKSIVCRNDLVALHLHGHTRLTGREQPVMRRLWHNSNVLDRHLGLWLKFQWWHDLANATGDLSAETLTIGLMVPDLPPPYGLADSVSPVLLEMGQLAVRLRKRWPGASVVLVHPGRDAMWVRGLHVLVVTNPDTQREELKSARSDLRCVAWVNSKPDQWVNSKSWMAWDAHLAASTGVLHGLQKLTTVAIQKGWSPHSPLGMRTLPVLGQPMFTWRAMVCWSVGSLRWDQEAKTHARTLQSTWLARGIPCHQRGAVRTTSMGPFGEVEPSGQPWVAQVCIWVLPGNYRKRHVSLPRLDAACLNVIWWLNVLPDSDTSQHWPEDESQYVARPDLEVSACPTVAEVEQAMEARIGRTFFAP